MSKVSAKDFGRVAVLLGGDSAEREISLRSGDAVYRALKELNVDVFKLDTQGKMVESLQQQAFDRAFIALHGRGGEDGVVQAILGALKIPFTGSDFSSSALAMDKVRCKQIWLNLGFKTANFECVNGDENLPEADARRLFAKLGPVLFVKPAREGSSVGMNKVQTPSDLIKAVKTAGKFDRDVLIESFIKGDEYTVAILKDNALPSICMRTPRDFYDYEAKYLSTETEYLCPSPLNSDEEEQIRNLAKKAFKAIGCRGWGRVDFIRDAISGEFNLLEVNTVPGMTETSLVPKSARQAGFDFKQLTLEILSTSLK